MPRIESDNTELITFATENDLPRLLQELAEFLKDYKFGEVVFVNISINDDWESGETYYTGNVKVYKKKPK
jgi:hypothetical protein